jgi:DNA-binding response OmpR family regulator
MLSTSLGEATAHNPCYRMQFGTVDGPTHCSRMKARYAGDRLALVVEDEVPIAMDIENVLVSEGFACVFAMEPSDVEAMPLDNLAVAVIDLRLRGCLAGRSVIRNLREQIPNLPVVVVTGFDLSSPEADLRGLGGPTDRLHKPVAPSELSRAVWEVIDRGRTGANTSPRRRREDVHQPTCSL